MSRLRASVLATLSVLGLLVICGLFVVVVSLEPVVAATIILGVIILTLLGCLWVFIYSAFKDDGLKDLE